MDGVGRDPPGGLPLRQGGQRRGGVTLSERLKDTRLPCGRDILPDQRLRTLDRELAELSPSRYGPAAALAAASASSQPTRAAAASRLPTPMWGGVYLSYSARGGSRNTRARRAYPLVGISPAPRIGGHSGPPVGPMPLFLCEGAAQLGPLRPVGPAVWSGLGRSLGDLPPILNNRVDHSLIMALSRVFVRLRDKMASVASRSMGDREAERLCTFGTAESLRLMLA